MIWKLVVVASVAFWAFRQARVLHHPLIRALRAAPPPRHDPKGEPKLSRRDNRLYIALVVVAAAAVAAWVVTKLTFALAQPGSH